MNPDDPDTTYYVPILRDGRIERDVIRQLGGLARFEERPRQPLPLVELLDTDELDRLDSYRDASGTVLVDVPVYLAEQANRYQEDAQELLADYENVSAFFNDHIGVIDVPVLSNSVERPLDYGEFVTLYNQLSVEYEWCALRLPITNEALTDIQQTALSNLSGTISTGDLVLFDLLDTGGFEGVGQMRAKLEQLVDEFQGSNTIVLNAFQPYDDVTLNYGPRIATEVDADGFGDFVVNRRIDRDIPVGNVDPTIRHYFPSASEVNEFTGEDYDAAQGQLTADPDWDGTHCDYCRRAEREGGHHGFWKEVRMGHYLDSVLSEEHV